VAEKLITAALAYAKDNNAKYVEAYPVDPDSPSYRFMGFKSMFANMGFELKHKAGQRRYVMVSNWYNVKLCDSKLHFFQDD
jgi:hypothetical protein